MATKFVKRLFPIYLLLGCLSISSPALATPVTATGTIRQFFLSGLGNYPFRVYLVVGSSDPLGTCTNAFAYLDISDANYEAMVASLLTAYGQGKQVFLSMDKDGVTGLCKISELAII